MVNINFGGPLILPFFYGHVLKRIGVLLVTAGKASQPIDRGWRKLRLTEEPPPPTHIDMKQTEVNPRGQYHSKIKIKKSY